MRCLSPRNVGYRSDGKTICWSKSYCSPEYPSFQLPCGKCIECRLEYARNWAVRSVHEAKMHENNAFITLTYENLSSEKLQYIDFQLFMKRVREKRHREFLDKFGEENWKLLDKNERKPFLDQNAISVFVSGEYGDKTKRPHWHAILFNWTAPDLKYKYTSDSGHDVSTSNYLNDLWGKGLCEIGSVTFESASYVARYAAKKLVHGNDGHDFEPISKKSSRYPIGKRYLEKYWMDIFNHGFIVLPNGSKTAIPRYYEKWLSKHHPDDYLRYLTNVKGPTIAEKSKQSTKEALDRYYANLERRTPLISKEYTRKVIAEKRFELLQSYLKGDF